MKNNNRFTLRLSDRQLETLKETAKKEKRTLAAVIRNLIDAIEEQDSFCETSLRNDHGQSIPKVNRDRI